MVWFTCSRDEPVSIDNRMRLQVEVENERRADVSQRLGPELILQVCSGHQTREQNMSRSYVRSPVMEKRFFEPRASPIPSAVRELILELGSNSPRSSLELRELQSPRFGTLFGGKHEFHGRDRKWANLSGDRVASIREMVITAMGNCPTLRALNLGNSHKLPRFHLTLGELQELLNPLQSSEVLLELNFDGQEVLETEDGCMILETFLMKNRSLETLHIFDSALNYRMIESLISNSHPSIRKLGLYLNPTEDGVFETVGAILQACPKLQEMPNVEWRCEDDEDAERWAEVLGKHDSFDAVEIAGPVQSLSVFLRDVLDSTCQLCVRKTLRKLKMMSLDDPFERMPEHIVSLTVSANENLVRLDLVGVCLTSNEWQVVFKTLKQNAVLQSLRLEDMQQGFDSDAWKELGALVTTSSKLGVLKIHNPCYDVRHSVEYIFRALQMNRSLKKVKLLMSGHEIDSEGVSALVKALEVNDALDHLALDGCVIPNLEAVFRSLRRNTKLRKLCLYSCKGLSDEAYRELSSALRKNSSIREIDLGHTNWITDGTAAGGRWVTPCEAIKLREREDRYVRVMQDFWEPTSNNFEQFKEKLNFGDR